MNKPLQITFLALALSFVAPIAHSWSDQEQELIDYVITTWDAWMEAVEKDDPQIWVKKGNIDKNYSMWWTEQGAPQGVNAVLRDWDSIRSTNIGWVDVRPVAVRVFDDVGFIQFYGYWKAKTEDGPVTTEYMRTEIFRKVDGEWTFIGGQGTPASNADAEPYK